MNIFSFSLFIFTLTFNPIPADISGRLLLTGGVSQIEGAAGGGLTPWAFIGGYGTKDQIGANAFTTEVQSQAYTVKAQGVLLGLFCQIMRIVY